MYTSNTDGIKTGKPAAIEAQGLYCSYQENQILKDVNFTVKQGEAFFIIGGSGCGKSTLLRTLVGLNAPQQGNVEILGKPFSKADIATRRVQLMNIGMLFQSSALWSSLTLRQNVSLPLEEHTSLNRKEIDEIAMLKLAQLGLKGFEDYYPSEISGGMKKRAGLARALVLDPAIVFFDEPWAGLDPITSRKLNHQIKDIQQTFGTTLVIVSHELESIFELADRVIMLDRVAKNIIAEGNPHDLLKFNNDTRVRDFLHRGATNKH
jgi:phospholipid/cholesterol/gamma-HCH transport system ATP-binding protein